MFCLGIVWGNSAVLSTKTSLWNVSYFRLPVSENIIFYNYKLSFNTFKMLFLWAQSREVVDLNPTSDMMGIFLRRAHQPRLSSTG